MLDFHTFSVANETTPTTYTKTTEEKPIKDMILDSLIVGGIVFFSTWNGTLDINNLLNALKGFGIAFLTQLAYYRGVKKL